MSNQDLTSSTGILAIFETSKAERTSFATDLIRRIEDGEADPLKIHLQIKAMEEIITSVTSRDEKKNKNLPLAKKYHEMLLASAEKHGKGFELFNAKFSISEVGTKYDYSPCNDPELTALAEQFADIKDKLDKRQKFLQLAPAEGVDVVNTDTGEAYKIYPPIKSSTTSVSVSLK